MVDRDLSGAEKVEHRIQAPAEAVWAVLADGWSFATWVVGASRIREVDRHWPHAGARIQHSVGLWPLLLNDHTEVISEIPNRELVLGARAWPVGEARVRITLEPDGADATKAVIEEVVDKGLGAAVPMAAQQLFVVPRNRETMRRLALLAEGKYGNRSQESGGDITRAGGDSTPSG
ncbi:MAG TPA: SRPBCC family protein [Actinomycetales bacterium]|jgi:hypothetical protein|nr:SRPBCC family protein [Actinomycetales bacterium]